MYQVFVCVCVCLYIHVWVVLMLTYHHVWVIPTSSQWWCMCGAHGIAWLCKTMVMYDHNRTTHNHNHCGAHSVACNVLQCVAVCCSVLQCVAVFRGIYICMSGAQSVTWLCTSVYIYMYECLYIHVCVVLMVKYAYVWVVICQIYSL